MEKRREYITAFVSYHRADKQTMLEIVKILQDLNVGVSYDSAFIEPGDSITDVVLETILTCQVFIVVVSAKSMESKWVQFEVGCAAASKIRIIPYLVGADVEMPTYLRERSYIRGLSELRAYLSKFLEASGRERPIIPAPEVFDFAGHEIPWVIIDGNGERQSVYVRENIRTHYSPVRVPLPPDIRSVVRAIAREEAAKREAGTPYCWNGPKYLLEKFTISRTPGRELPVIELWLRDSTYYAFLATNHDPANRMVSGENGAQVSIEAKYMKNWDYLRPVPYLANSLGVNLAILTNDRYLLLTKRSQQVYGYRDIYDVSVVEGVNPRRDVDEKNCPDLFRTATRGTDEELGLPIKPEQVVFLSFGAKTKDKQYAMLGMSIVDASSREVHDILAKKLGKDAWEGKVTLLDANNPELVLQFIFSHDPSNWSPNGLVCIFQTLIHEYGKRVVEDLVQRLK